MEIRCLPESFVREGFSGVRFLVLNRLLEVELLEAFFCECTAGMGFKVLRLCRKPK
jgi:hypothetical protein